MTDGPVCYDRSEWTKTENRFHCEGRPSDMGTAASTVFVSQCRNNDGIKFVQGCLPRYRWYCENYVLKQQFWLLIGIGSIPFSPVVTGRPETRVAAYRRVCNWTGESDVYEIGRMLGTGASSSSCLLGRKQPTAFVRFYSGSVSGMTHAIVVLVSRLHYSWGYCFTSPAASKDTWMWVRL